MGFLADQHERTVIALAAQRFGGLDARLRGADDDERMAHGLDTGVCCVGQASAAWPTPGKTCKTTAWAKSQTRFCPRWSGTPRMRYIDAFNHFFPKRFFAGLLETPAAQKDMGKRVRGIRALFDLDERLRIVDSFPDYSQVLSLAMPAIDRLWNKDAAPTW